MHKPDFKVTAKQHFFLLFCRLSFLRLAAETAQAKQNWITSINSVNLELSKCLGIAQPVDVVSSIKHLGKDVPTYSPYMLRVFA